MALADFNRGLILLLLGRQEQARQAFKRAESLFPEIPLRLEIGRIETHDDHTRALAQRVWDAAEDFPLHPVAA